MNWDDNGWSDSFDAPAKYKSDHNIDEQVLKQRALKRQIKNDRLALKIAKNLNDLCKEPKPGEQWRIITEKSFNAFALIMHLLQTRKIKELYLAVYRINDYFVFEGSGNMSDNARIEQYIYENSKEMYEFHRKWMLQLVTDTRAK